jgi:DNA-binding MarR family transcriptional regulator
VRGTISSEYRWTFFAFLISYCDTSSTLILTKRITKSKEPLAVSQADYEHLAAFRHALRDFVHFSEQAALAAGVPPQQHQAMLVIRGFPHRDSLTVGELAGQLRIKHHSAVGLVNRMAADGLVNKSQDPNNRRQVLVQLTPRGGRVLENLSPAHKAELARISPILREILKYLESAA